MLADKKALITGSSRGIGRAIALELAENGADVCVNYTRSADRAEEVVKEIESLGQKGVLVQADVGKFDQAERLVKKAVETLGRLDILINNAGITRDGLLLRMSPEDWADVLQTNLTGVYNCTKAAVRPMLKGEGSRIINISSVVAQIGNAGQANYAAAKAGIAGFTRSMARELASRGICVNTVAPGYIDTDMTSDLPEKASKKLLEQVPLGRPGQARDVAQAVVFLASDKASYITGQTLNVDGGMVMHG